MKQRKEIAKSIRMTNEVYNFVNAFQGEGFNEKFENLVLFCLKEEKEIKKRIAHQQKLEENNRCKITTQNKILKDLERVSREVTYLIGICDSLESDSEGFRLQLAALDNNVTQKSKPSAPVAVQNELQNDDVEDCADCVYCDDNLWCSERDVDLSGLTSSGNTWFNVCSSLCALFERKENKLDVV